MALPYVPIPFPSVVYPSSSSEPARTVQSAAELTTLNTSLASMGSAVSFTGQPSVTPKAPATVVVKSTTLNALVSSTVQAHQLRNS